MALTRPTLNELVARIQADFVSRLALTGPVRRRSIVYVLSRVLAGAVHMLYGAIEYLSRQLFADQSDAEYLEREAGCYGVARLAPTYATALIAVTGSPGSEVPAGALLQSASGGYEYRVDVGGTIPGGGSMSLATTAVLFGAAPSTSVGASLTFESPVAGAQAQVFVSACIDGTDREPLEDFRQRFLERKALRGGNGGSIADYIAWAKEVAGVTRVWVAPQGVGPGSVLVRFARDNDPGTVIPDAAEVAAVQAHLNVVKPATCALVQVMAPIENLQYPSIHINPDTPAIRAAVIVSIQAMLYRRMTPVGGGTLYISWWQTAVGDAAGVDTFAMVYPTIDTAYGDGQLLRLGTVTWV
jgi:uncharacterized phage protein gp47/JayE